MRRGAGSRTEFLKRIESALHAAERAAAPYFNREAKVCYKANGDPVTEVERRINEVLHRRLVRDNEGWLSEETADDLARLTRSRLWVVDPIDGTREFVEGIPEWCISVGLVEDGEPVAGGVLNPATNLMVLGTVDSGLIVNGGSRRLSERAALSDCVVLASRSEVGRGEWKWCGGRGYEVRPMGSVALKLSLVAAGAADATWTLVPKHEWDVAAGVALVRSAGGEVYDLKGEIPSFNQRDALMPGLIAHRPGLRAAISAEIASRRS